MVDCGATTGYGQGHSSGSRIYSPETKTLSYNRRPDRQFKMVSISIATKRNHLVTALNAEWKAIWKHLRSSTFLFRPLRSLDLCNYWPCTLEPSSSYRTFLLISWCATVTFCSVRLLCFSGYSALETPLIGVHYEMRYINVYRWNRIQLLPLRQWRLLGRQWPRHSDAQEGITETS